MTSTDFLWTVLSVLVVVSAVPLLWYRLVKFHVMASKDANREWKPKPITNKKRS